MDCDSDSEPAEGNTEYCLFHHLNFNIFKMKKLICIAFLVYSFSSTISIAQVKRDMGLSASIQGNQYGIIVPFWLGEKFVIAPEIAISAAQKLGTDIEISLSPRFYIKNEKLCPYYGFKFGTLIFNNSSSSPSTTSSAVDLTGGILFGVEYFLTEVFSVSVEAQGVITKSDRNSNRFGNPGGVNFNTATALTATIYF